VDKHVRACCPATGAIASLPERALDLGHIKGWVKATGPAPSRPKSRRRLEAAGEHLADSKSANEKE
jgi:hypothetical protein